ncbi:hypothetical protein SAMN05444267_102819 [Chryseobacterium polytrichastri]|uniref:Uncharacterized protein n=1 Tax=Chryseobacterium polytrichastri TaxID=1302687 RepID=A0A1M7EFQ5_9FLAO|nr:hypothetical protein SAMN05444267_102819 [Chryseobacterium polytrichastri]
MVQINKNREATIQTTIIKAKYFLLLKTSLHKIRPLKVLYSIKSLFKNYEIAITWKRKFQ